MDADEIQPITPETVAQLLAAEPAGPGEFGDTDHRAHGRWPFPGAVELWIPDQSGQERHVLGACHNLSESGLGVRVDEPLEVGATLNIAVHQPVLSLHGKATVRHCSARGRGFLAGLAFEF